MRTEKTMIFKLIALAAISALAGCVSMVEEKIVAESEKTAAILKNSVSPLQVTNAAGNAVAADARSAQQRQPWVARRATKPWYGAQSVQVQSDEQLPPIFQETYTFSFDDRARNGIVPLDVVVERISKLTNIPIRIKADVYTAPQTPKPPSQPSGAGGPTGFASSVNSNPLFIPTPGTPVTRPGATDNTIPAPLPINGVNQNTVSVESVQAAAMSVTDLYAVDMRWKAKDITSFLNYITDRLGLSWSYRDGVVYIERFVTESFEMAVFQSSQSYNMSLNGSSGGSAGGGATTGGSSAAFDVQESGKTDIVKGIVDTVKAMVSPIQGSSVTISEGSGNMLVTAPKDVLTRVRTLIRSEQESFTRQVLIQIDIYSVTSTDNSERGISFNAAFQNLANSLNLNLNTATTLVGANAASLGIVSTSSPNSGVLDARNVIAALSQTGVAVQHRPISMIALNRQWARKTSLRSTGYLSETTPAVSSVGGSGTPGLKTASVTTGDRFIIQPAILSNSEVILKFGVSLTDLISLFDVTTGQGATLQRVQTPEVAGTDDQSSVKLKAGEVMMLTGVSRLRGSTNNRRLADGAPLLLGGSSTGSSTREDFIIFVRPVIL